MCYMGVAMKHFAIFLLSIALFTWCIAGNCARPNYGDGTWDCDQVASITYRAAEARDANDGGLSAMAVRSQYSNNPKTDAIVLDAFNSGWRGLSPTELAQANYRECKSRSIKLQPSNVQSDSKLQGAELRWQLLHGLGKMVPPFLLGVVLIGGLWLVTALWRKGRRRRADN